LEPAALRQESTKAQTLEPLSTREREVLKLVADGLSNAAIAGRLRLSDHTVKRHVANILLKLDLPTRAAAAAFLARQRSL
jgi:DNA-binding NarL/FixJ family response regulator